MNPLAVNFAAVIVYWVDIAIFFFAITIEVWAFGHCLLQRPDAFRAVGTLSKGLWLALTGGGMLLTLLVITSPTGILGLIGLTAAAIYLLDVRPAVRDAAGGSPGW